MPEAVNSIVPEQADKLNDSVIRTKGFTHQRLYSLDALRGFDMFWIMGGEFIVHGMARATHAPFWLAFSNQLQHPDWDGFHAYDLIFPLFLFLAGVSSPYSVGSALEKGESRQKLLLRVIKRGLILVFLGICFNILTSDEWFDNIRYCSVLGRIGLAYMFANIIYLYAKPAWQIAWCVALIAGYWLLLKFMAAPGFPAGDLTMQGNFASYVDRSVLPGTLYNEIHDPEGLMSTIPAIGTGLLGIFAGKVLKSDIFSQVKKALVLAAAGALFIACALLWNMDFPFNKNLWSSSFVMLTAGLSLLLLSLFYYIIDVCGYRTWALFFRVIGMNSILIYLAAAVFRWRYFARIIGLGIGGPNDHPYNLAVIAICVVTIKWLALYVLYRKKIFLRV